MTDPAGNYRHVVALSGGKDSTALALLLVEREPRPYTFVCTPTGDEPEAMFEHWRFLGGLLGSPILPVMATWRDKESGLVTGGLRARIRHEGETPNNRLRWCTRILKIEPYRAKLKEWAAEGPIVSHVGLRADEEGRAGGAYDDIPGVEMRFLLREIGWGENDVLGYLDQRGVRIPERTDCRRCYHQQIGEWWRFWNEDPEGFDSAIEDERLTDSTFRNPRLDADGAPLMVTRWGLTFAACWRDTWPVRLEDMRAVFRLGIIPKGADYRDLFRGVGACRACTL